MRRLAELVRLELKLKPVDIINGETPVSARKEINDRFQRQLQADEGCLADSVPLHLDMVECPQGADMLMWT